LKRAAARSGQKKVPSDPRTGGLAGCAVAARDRIPGIAGWRPDSPPGLSPGRISAPHTASSAAWVSRRLETAFHSPTADSVLTAASAGSELLACLFAALPRARTAARPVRGIRSATHFFAPLWDVAFPPDPHSPCLAVRKLAYAGRWPSAPPREGRPGSRRHGSSGRTELRLAWLTGSVDRLEPQPSCTRSAPSSTETRRFPQLSSPLFSSTSGHGPLGNLWKNQKLPVLFLLRTPYWLAIFSSRVSSMTGIPNSRAFSSFEPASSPATT
jgi:hypothetical protein